MLFKHVWKSIFVKKWRYPHDAKNVMQMIELSTKFYASSQLAMIFIKNFSYLRYPKS